MAGPLKYTVTHYRRKDRTHEEFLKWFVEEHLPLAMPIFKRHGVLEYTLFVTPEDLNGALKQELTKVRPTWDVADFDCFLEFTIPSAQTIKDVMSDPDWLNAIKDENEWCDMSRSLASLGYATPYLLKTGEVVNLPKFK
ncbi:hypothetical protein N656DRAFT_801420 [Canariomyces notabilis]|uniref:EthD domain-containing protein n=1 Tax=Canariomyces notabilis TaxID=2074819 RepID=A0AAN6T990_9PEZI|nr:hypothetical protein N656DRAFT_801420 [Canariomyces arenarius]